jgi:hypothetical protein
MNDQSHSLECRRLLRSLRAAATASSTQESGGGPG